MAKILLVEDDKSLREIYGVRLMAEGYQIVSAGDGEEALAMAIKERPDLIVSDVMMPKISGFDMLDILRSTTETKSVKVIMMTALSSEDQRARGEALGADRYLVKSQVGIEDVVRTVHDVLGDSPASAPASSQFATLAEPPVAPEPIPTPAAAVPVPEPSVAPAPLPPAVPVTPVATIAPEPLAPAPTPEPVQPLPPVQPAAPLFQPAQPAAPTTPFAPVAPTPQPVAPVVPQPVVAPTPEPSLPQPTAPFSSPRPASLGDRVINPISPASNFQTPPDMGALMNQELNATATPPAPQQPPQPPVPPVPPISGV